MGRVMSLSRRYMERLVEDMDSGNREAFLRDFFHHYLETGAYRVYRNARGESVDLASDVVNYEGRPVTVDLRRLSVGSVEEASPRRLMKAWLSWLSMTKGSPLSFVVPGFREKFFLGRLPGLGRIISVADYREGRNWSPIFGLPQRYIEGLTYDIPDLWELNFVPHDDYGQFEEMMGWFRGELADADGRPFESPGHQRIVFPVSEDGQRLRELIKIVQALLVVSEASEGKVLESINVKRAHPDGVLAANFIQKRGWSRKGAVRLEWDRWGRGRLGVELRAGIKRNDRMGRFIRTVMASRIAAADFSRIEEAPSWTLLSDWGEGAEKTSLGTTAYAVALKNSRYDLPFWNWDRAPFIGPAKKSLLVSLAVEFRRQLSLVAEALQKDGDVGLANEKLMALIGGWIEESRIEQDLMAYIRPGRPSESEKLTSLLASSGRGASLGIEYTGRFPVGTGFEDSYPAVIEGVAQSLADFLGGRVRRASDRLSLVVDSQGRRWRVAWSQGGELLVGTPLFDPGASDVGAVYGAFAENNVVASPRFGGGHIGVDLDFFGARAEVLARFLSLFHEYAGILSLMFQHVERTGFAGRVAMGDHFRELLADFRSTDEELKALLYNNLYFNTRSDGPTRHSQIDLTDYFRGVVPQGRRHSFDLRKEDRGRMWLRFFDAPRDAVESALQIRMVKALLAEALDGPSLPPSSLSRADHLFYVRTPRRAYADLDRLCLRLGIDCGDYRPLVGEALSEAELFFRIPSNVAAFTKRAFHVKGWGRALVAGGQDCRRVLTKMAAPLP